MDPFAGTTCAAGQFCNAGACVPSCAGVTCAKSQVCMQGICTRAPCLQTCDHDSFCDVSTGACRPSPCSAVPCPAGRICLNTTGLCTDNPCEQVHCGTGQVCVVGDDGSPDCAIPAVNGNEVQAHSEGSGVFGCSCALASAPTGGRRGWLAALLVMSAVGIWRGRRRRALPNLK